MTPRRRRMVVAALLAAWAQGGAGAGTNDPRIQVIDYDPMAVVPLTLFVGYHLHLEFATDERFLSIGAGDTSTIDVGAEGNHLLLKARQATAATNLTIVTNRRAYFFDYRAIARAPRAGEILYSIAYRYPAPVPAATATASEREQAAKPAIAPRPAQNTDYWYCGAPVLRPVAAFDDGLQLHLRFAPHAALPAVYASEPDGTEALVNTNVEDDQIIVHRLAERYVLRRGSLVGCVRNRSYPAIGERAERGTVDPAVRRETLEGGR